MKDDILSYQRACMHYASNFFFIALTYINYKQDTCYCEVKLTYLKGKDICKGNIELEQKQATLEKLGIVFVTCIDKRLKGSIGIKVNNK